MWFAKQKTEMIDPALRACGWTEDLIFREQTPGAIVLQGRRPRRLVGRVDYLLRVRMGRMEPKRRCILAIVEACRRLSHERVHASDLFDLGE